MRTVPKILIRASEIELTLVHGHGMPQGCHGASDLCVATHLALVCGHPSIDACRKLESSVFEVDDPDGFYLE